MNDPFVERITRTRTDKGKNVLGIMIETRSQKSSEGQKVRLEVEVHPDSAMDENQEGHGPEGRGNRILASERFCHFHRDPGPRRDVGTVRHLY